MSLTDRDKRDLIVAMQNRFNARVWPKREFVTMRAIADLFEVLALLGVEGTPDFDRYWTTIGPFIFSPKGHAPSGDDLSVIAHEMGHVVQWHRDHVRFAAEYLASPERRAVFEAEAERGRFEVLHLIGEPLPQSLGDLDMMRHGYMVDDAHADLCRDLCEQHLASVASGVISTDVGLFVRDWLEAKGAANADR